MPLLPAEEGVFALTGNQKRTGLKRRMNEIAVLKFGGTSVKSIGRIEHVADIIGSYRQRPVLVVVSAMGGTTDYLINLARQCSAQPDRRELDLLLATGEQVSIVLLTLILARRGITARSLTGQQAGIVTDGEHGSARILDIDTNLVQRALGECGVVVVAGFQGVSEKGEVTTLGRGGSDTSAVALAAALGSKECQIYTDVNGIFTADPNLISNARPLSEITYTDCVHMARNGAQVIHPRAVELAEHYEIAVRVRNTFNPEDHGTIIRGELTMERERRFSGVAIDGNYGCVTVEETSANRHSLSHLIAVISKHCRKVDVASLKSGKFGDRSIEISFKYDSQEGAQEMISALQHTSPGIRVSARLNLKRLSLVGSGVIDNAEITSRIATVLERNGIEPKSVQSSEHVVHCLLDSAEALDAARLIHDDFEIAIVTGSDGFGLEKIA